MLPTVLTEHFNGTAEAADGLLMAEECRDVEHSGSLANAYQCQAERIHHITLLVTLGFNPCPYHTLLVLQREIIE